MYWGAALLAASIISSLYSGSRSESAARRQAEEARKAQQEQNALNSQMFQQKMAMEKANMENQFALSGAQLAAQYGAPGQPVTVKFTDPGGGGNRPGGTCPEGHHYVRKEKGDKSPDGRTLVAGEEYCIPD